MPSNISNYLEAAWLNATFRNTAYTSPAIVYLALYTADPTEADTGTEVTGGAYARQAAAFAAPSQVAGKATIQNSADIQFPIATADWGTVTHIGIRDAAANGNLLYYGPIATARAVLTNDRLKFLAGDLKIDLD
jgi:hypothetical protein